MSQWEHSRHRIFNPAQHPLVHSASDFGYVNPALPPAVNTIDGALNYIFAALYPKYIGTYATPAALPVSSSPNDYAVVTDDGDGKSAGYVWTEIDGAAQWMKRYDQDWSVEDILAETTNRTQYMYVQKYGMQDKDSAGVVLTGLDAGQHIFGSDQINEHLTLHANSGDTLGARTGYIQFDDDVRPTVDNLLDLGTNALRFANIFLSVGIFADTMTIQSGQISDSTGTINFDDENLVTTGAITGGSLVSGTLTISDGSIVDSDGVISFGATALQAVSLTLGTLALSDGSIVDSDGTISFGATALTTTGTVTGNHLVGSTDAIIGNLLLSGATLKPNTGNTNLVLQGAGAGIVDIQDALTTLAITATGIVGVTGSITVDNLSLDGNTLASTDTNGNILLSPNGSGSVEISGKLVPSTNNSKDLGATALKFKDLYLAGVISNGSTYIDQTALQSLRAAAWRDSGQSVPAQAGDALFFDGSQWIASAPDTEIAHGSLTGLTTGDAGHTQFALLVGRAGGQTLRGGTAASENLVLESTFHATKGYVLVKDVLAPNTTASFSVTWSGTDIGDATHYFRDIYTKGELKGARVEGFATGSLPAASAQNPGRLLWDTTTSSIKVDIGGSLVEVIMGSGAQTVGGAKTFTSGAIFSSYTAEQRRDENGTATVVALAVTKGFVKLTSGGTPVTQISTIAAGVDGQSIEIYNNTGAAVVIKDQSAALGSAGDRIATSDGNDITLEHKSPARFRYDTGQSRWVVAGGGSGGGSVTIFGSRAAARSIVAATGITSGASHMSTTATNQDIYVEGSAAGANIAATITAGTKDGQIMRLIGRNDDKTVDLDSTTTNVELNGGSISLDANKILTLRWDTSKWVEAGRNR